MNEERSGHLGKLKTGMVVRHWKGGLYRIACIASHTETGKQLVIYQSLDDGTKIYAMPYEDFIGNYGFFFRFTKESGWPKGNFRGKNGICVHRS